MSCTAGMETVCTRAPRTRVRPCGTRMLTAASDSTSILWNALTGEELFKFHHEVAVKFVDYSLGDELSLHVTDNIMGKAPALKIYRMADDLSEQLDVPVREIVCKDFPERCTRRALVPSTRRLSRWTDLAASKSGIQRRASCWSRRRCTTGRWWPFRSMRTSCR